MANPKLVVLSGAGISAESGIKTFRDANGLWEGHDIMEVASPMGWARNPEVVLEFYNQRRRQMTTVGPNPAHFALKKLEEQYDVQVVTQNVDDLHERAGSSKILHLHGEIAKVRSTGNEELVYDWTGKDLNWGDVCEEGHQLRPHIVWFGEDVPHFEYATTLVKEADVLLIVGTSMVVYPANTLVEYAPEHARIFLIDPKVPDYSTSRNIQMVIEKASLGVPALADRLLNQSL